MKSTIVDVAKEAKVSVATVSRVINGNYPVKEETKQKVLEVIEKLNYTPNVSARELTTQRSTTIGIVVPSINNMFFPEVINGIESKLKEQHYSMVLCLTNNDKQQERNSINDLVGRNVSGIIVIDPNTENVESKFYNTIAKDIPLVFVNGYTKNPNISYVANDEEMGACIALDYLIDNNHKDILFIRGANSYSYDIKEKAYIETMNNINSFNDEYIVNVGKGNSSETVNNTVSKVVEILKNNNTVSAVFACNDLMAIGVINACKKLGINIPNDLSVIGFDNIELGEMIEPKLTTIDQNMRLLGSNASTLLMEKINTDNKYSKRIVLNNILVDRDTVSKKL